MCDGAAPGLHNVLVQTSKRRLGPSTAGPWPDSRRHAFPLRGTQTAPLCTGPSSHSPGLSRGREHAGRPAATLTDRKAASLRRAETEPATCQSSQGETEGQTLPSGVSLLGDGARTNGLPLKTLSAQGSTQPSTRQKGTRTWKQERAKDIATKTLLEKASATHGAQAVPPCLPRLGRRQQATRRLTGSWHVDRGLAQIRQRHPGWEGPSFRGHAAFPVLSSECH